MSDAFRITWQSLKDLWDEFVTMVMMNVLWSLTVLLVLAPQFLWAQTNLPLALILSFLLSWPLPIVSGSVCFVANQSARGKAIDWGTFAEGIRRYWAKSLLVAVINLVILALLAANLVFYGLVLQGTWTKVVLGVWIIVGVYWLVTQVYWFPMILELESEKVLLALRNALGLVIISPVFSLVVAVILLLLAVLCISLMIPALLFMVVLLMLITNHATRNRLAYVQEKREKWEREENEEE